MALALLRDREMPIGDHGPRGFGRDAPRGRILVVDRDAETLVAVQSLVSSRGYEAVAFAHADEALDAFDARPATSGIVLDLTTAGVSDGLNAVAAFRQLDRDVPILVLSTSLLDASAARATAVGATAFVMKPLAVAEFEGPLLSALAHHQPSVEMGSLRSPLLTDAKYPLLLGEGPLMADIAALIRRVADTDVTILIRGESGTGKEVVARAISASSRRREKPFVKVNCAAIPGELLESELFGYERGAFTDAVQHKPGKFEFANHGTIFLDEVGEIGVGMQAKLLHVLQDGEFSRLGGNRDVHVDVRIIAATNRDLEAAVAKGQFRSDLFFRLNVIAITLPPLRDRLDDVPQLMDHFLRKYCAQYNRPSLKLSADTDRWFRTYDWPGNVRELENAIKHAVILGGEAPVARDLASYSQAHESDRGPRRLAPAPAIPASGERRRARVERRAVSMDVAAARSASPLRAVPPPTRPAPPPVATASAPAAPEWTSPRPLKEVAREAARQAEHELILQVLQRTRWNRKAAAALLSISYKALLYKIKENGLDLAKDV